MGWKLPRKVSGKSETVESQKSELFNRKFRKFRVQTRMVLSKIWEYFVRLSSFSEIFETFSKHVVAVRPCRQASHLFCKFEQGDLKRVNIPLF